MRALCWILVVVFAATSAGLTYKFVIHGETVVHADTRKGILLTADERSLVLAEMRAFLNAVQQITSAISRDDSAAIAAAARRVGAAAQGEVPASLVGKLPLAFKTLGFDTHRRFDQLALDTEEMEDSSLALEQLSELMQNCATCHAAYRLDVRAPER